MYSVCVLPLSRSCLVSGVKMPPERAHPGLAPPDGPRPNGARFLVAAEDFGDAAVRYAQLAGDDAGSDAVVRHLHDLMADVVGQRPAVDEHPAELVNAALAQRGRHCLETNTHTHAREFNTSERRRSSVERNVYQFSLKITETSGLTEFVKVENDCVKTSFKSASVLY